MTGDLKQTPLHAAHVEAGAKMVPFAGWHMPVQYRGIVAEHTAVRQEAGIFDVSHMGEVDFRGDGALDAVATLVTNDVTKLVDGKAMYTVTCRPDGGIVDDCIVYRFAADHYRIVINAANIDKDVAHFREHAGSLCDLTDRSDDFGLLAVQGPAARELVFGLSGDALREVPSFGMGSAEIAGVQVTAARTGYTGEDGFELFVAAADTRKVWDAVVSAGAEPIGLGARDTLRLEARLCLYGNDIDETTHPYEAGLGWVVKPGREGVPKFVGFDALATAKQAGVSRKLVGFTIQSRGIIRPDAEVLGDGDEVVGRVTSGGVAPTVGGSIGMGYVPTDMAGPGKPLRLRQRGKILDAQQVNGPFYRRG